MNKRMLVYNEKKKRKKKHTWGSRRVPSRAPFVVSFPCPLLVIVTGAAAGAAAGAVVAAFW